jgi:hypothetical protein
MTVPPSNTFGKLLAALMGIPERWTWGYIAEVIARCNRRIATLCDRLEDIAQGREIPQLENIALGSDRQFQMAVMFLDICGFTTIRSSD